MALNYRKRVFNDIIDTSVIYLFQFNRKLLLAEGMFYCRKSSYPHLGFCGNSTI